MDAGFYWPTKYYRGLTKRKQTQRRKEIESRSKLSWRNPRAYKTFKTDVGVRTKSSGYTRRWKSMYPESSGVASAAKISGVPKSILQKSYDRGMAAWRTGHRPGATQQQWGYARVSSLLLCGKTHYSTDADLVKKARQTSPKARQWFRRCPKTPPQ